MPFRHIGRPYFRDEPVDHDFTVFFDLLHRVPDRTASLFEHYGDEAVLRKKRIRIVRHRVVETGLKMINVFVPVILLFEFPA